MTPLLKPILNELSLDTLLPKLVSGNLRVYVGDT